MGVQCVVVIKVGDGIIGFGGVVDVIGIILREIDGVGVGGLGRG